MIYIWYHKFNVWSIYLIHVYIYIFTYIYTYTHIYIYICIQLTKTQSICQTVPSQDRPWRTLSFQRGRRGRCLRGLPRLSPGDGYGRGTQGAKVGRWVVEVVLCFFCYLEILDVCFTYFWFSCTLIYIHIIAFCFLSYMLLNKNVYTVYRIRCVLGISCGIFHVCVCV